MAKETRQKLILAAEKCIAINGIEGIKLNAVIADAGVSNAAAVNYHFRTKFGLVQETLLYRVDAVLIHRRAVLQVLRKNNLGDNFAYRLMLVLFPYFEVVRGNLPESYYGRMLANVDPSNPEMLSLLTSDTVQDELGFEQIFRETMSRLVNQVGKQRMAHVVRLMMSCAALSLGETERNLSLRLLSGELTAETMTTEIDQFLFELVCFLYQGAGFKDALPEAEHFTEMCRQAREHIPGTLKTVK